MGRKSTSSVQEKRAAERAALAGDTAGVLLFMTGPILPIKSLPYHRRTHPGKGKI